MKNQNSNLQNLQPIKTLRFKDTALDVFEIEGEQYMTSKAIAQALGYNDTKSVTILYTENKHEFTEKDQRVIDLITLSEPAMTRIVHLKTKTNVSYKLRLFNKRGAYLIAMLSKTKNAADFRKWVLDVLEGKETIKENVKVEQKENVTLGQVQIGGSLIPENESKIEEAKRTLLVNAVKVKIFHHNCQSFKSEINKLLSGISAMANLVDNFEEHTAIIEKELDELRRKL
jgi:prophage antirepressor-like protein